MEIIGREAEKQRLEDIYASKNSEFLVVYGRRRVGKTYLIKQHFENRFTFSVTGMYKQPKEVQLSMFGLALQDYFDIDTPTLASWLEAFVLLRKCLKDSQDARKLIFIDEISWFDTGGNEFVAALEWFWNSWAASESSVFLVVCGSATSWITNKLLANKGGLFNRVTCQMFLLPFTLHETELYLLSKGINWSRYDITECYMIMGGIPFYLKQLDAKLSYSANIDNMFFKKNGRLKDEFSHLYNTLFENADFYIRIVETLSNRPNGMTRDEICKEAKIADNGYLSNALKNLVNCNCVRCYNYFGKRKKGLVYQLADYFSMFYMRFIKEHYGRDEHYWSRTIDLPTRRSWGGFMFEQICKDHIEQVKRTIGVSAVVSEQSTWYHKPKEAGQPRGAQIDLLIDRRDRVINVCEIKFSQSEYVIDKDYEAALRRKMGAFRDVTKKRNALHLTMITTYGVKKNSYSGIVQSEVVMDDLYAG